VLKALKISICRLPVKREDKQTDNQVFLKYLMNFRYNLTIS